MNENAVIRGSEEPNVLIRRGRFGHRHARREHYVKTDMEGRRPHEDRLRAWDDADEARKDPPQRLEREKSPCKHFDFWTSSLQNRERINFCCFKPVCGTLLWQLQETNVEGTLTSGNRAPTSSTGEGRRPKVARRKGRCCKGPGAGGPTARRPAGTGRMPETG